MKQMEINFVGSGNAVNSNNLVTTPLAQLFKNTDSTDISMSDFVFEINKNFELETSSTNDIYNIYTYTSEKLDCKIKIRVSKDPDFVKLNQEEYNRILKITQRRPNVKRGVIYNKTAKKVLSPGKIALVTLVSAVVIIGGTMVVNAVKESAEDPNNILYNLTHYVSTVPGVPAEVQNAQLRQQQQKMIQEENLESNNFYK